MGLALNRFIGNSILPALIKYSKYYSDAESHSPLLEATLHTVYRYTSLHLLLQSLLQPFLIKDINAAIL